MPGVDHQVPDSGRTSCRRLGQRSGNGGKPRRAIAVAEQADLGQRQVVAAHSADARMNGNTVPPPCVH